MGLRRIFLNLIPAVIVLCFPAAILGQAPPHADDTSGTAGRLSEPSHSATYTEAVRSNGIQPNWNRGYLAHLTGKRTPGSANVEVYDRDGKHVLDARIWFPGAVEVFLADALPLEGGGVLASGHASTDESIANFAAKTDGSGNVIAVLKTETLWPGRVCEQPDGTVWVFGRDLQKEKANNDAHDNMKDNDYLLLRQYSFEGGLLHGYLSRDSIALRKHAVVGGAHRGVT
jgi:hypothetical protein